MPNLNRQQIEFANAVNENLCLRENLESLKKQKEILFMNNPIIEDKLQVRIIGFTNSLFKPVKKFYKI